MVPSLYRNRLSVLWQFCRNYVRPRLNGSPLKPPKSASVCVCVMTCLQLIWFHLHPWVCCCNNPGKYDRKSCPNSFRSLRLAKCSAPWQQWSFFGVPLNWSMVVYECQSNIELLDVWDGVPVQRILINYSESGRLFVFSMHLDSGKILNSKQL